MINEEILLGERQLYSAKKDMLVNDGKWNYLKHNIYEEGGRYLLDIDGSTEEVIRKEHLRGTIRITVMTRCSHHDIISTSRFMRSPGVQG